ncbi:redoxin domain-containing protein [Siculibacillus lacustris]|uniref:Redoxin domain-containing protein n=1 Tax=Siculibacillus lacustris TaxID=1549641 RepID=A0A4Q9VG38_9HYPH|nr:TlpA disulfide reductase family protein [Siculibacillus lacustris]TBW33954.1 redoxin domain-containing protein [Siculibacillus lacustris]
MTEPEPLTASQPEPAPRDRRRLAAVALVAGVILGVGAVYAVGGFGGNAQDAGKCALDRALVDRLTARSIGEVAAFAPAAPSHALGDLAFAEPDGRPTTLAARRGRVVLLNLWATWCVPCRKEMPALDRLQSAVGSPDFEVVAVNLDQRDPDKPRRFRDETGIRALAAYADPSLGIFREMQKIGLAHGLPTTVLVSREGCELGSMAGPAEWDGADARALIGEALKR